MTMAPQNQTPESALLAHILAQLESNIHFLVAQNYIPSAEASAFLAKLPDPSSPATFAANSSSPSANGGTGSLVSRLRNLTTSGGGGGGAAPPAAPPRPTPGVQQARALWAYNEHGQDADDLSFAAGDTIDILEETNADWWLGRAHGRQALFPSSYVQKITPPAPASAPSSNAASAPFTPSYPVRGAGAGAGNAGAKPAYRPFGAAHHGADAPPPSGAGVNSVGLQQAPGTEEKKSKFGKYGNTMAHSAAGGVGFGAGAAIGGGLVRAIF